MHGYGGQHIDKSAGENGSNTTGNNDDSRASRGCADWEYIHPTDENQDFANWDGQV